jgi:hypothetical protein
VFLLTVCGGDEKSCESVSQDYYDITTTLQDSIFNAIDDSRITDISHISYLISIIWHMRFKRFKGEVIKSILFNCDQYN